MKKRFKTKQEFKGGFLNWANSMNYLFGLPFDGEDWMWEEGRITLYPHLTDGPGDWFIYEEHLTTAPHPYKGKRFAVKCENKDQVKKARKKMIALGFKDRKEWNDEWENKAHPPYLIKRDWNEFSIHNHDDKEKIILTFQEFWEGYWPNMKEEKTKEKEDAIVLGYRDVGTMDSHNLFVILKTPNHTSIEVSIDDLHEYNILSREEFDAKYPPEPMLKFKKWEVTAGEYIEFGCPGHDPVVILEPKQIREFMTIMDYIRKYKQDANDVYDWLKEHKKQLGL